MAVTRWRLDRWRRRTYFLAGAAMVTVSIAGAVALIASRWSQARAETHPPGLVPIVVAAVANLAANGVLVQAWRRLLAAASVQLRFGPAAWAWAAGQLTRYTFVSGVQIGGRAAAARAAGVSFAAGAATTVVEMVWQLSLIAAVALLTAPWWVGAGDQLDWLALAGVVPLGALLVVLVRPGLLAEAASRLLARTPGLRDRILPRSRLSLTRVDALGTTGLYAVNTVLRLVAFLTLFAAVGGDPAAQGLRAVGAWALGQLAGRLALFAPGGIGPQEAAAAVVLAPVLGPVGLALVALVRAVEIVAELVGLGAARLLRRSAGRAR